MTTFNMTSVDCNATNATNISDCDVYDYDLDYDVPLDELVPVVTSYAWTLLVGLLGNCLVIFSVSYYRRMRTVTNIFLLSLATADLLLILVCVPIKAVAFFSFTWEFGKDLCKLVNYVQSCSMICSVLTLTVISLERVVVVMFPLQAKYLCTMQHAQIVVIGVWIITSFLALPTWFIYIHLEVGELHKAYWCLKNYDDQDIIIAYEMYMLTLLFLIPVIVMVVAYTIIGIKVWRVGEIHTAGRVISAPNPAKQRGGATSESSERALLGNGKKAGNARKGGRQQEEKGETRKQVVGMLVMVVVLFAICWGPILFNNVLTATGHLHRLHYGFLKPMRQAFFLMSYLNSCLNPIVYAFFSRNFRQSFKMAICACVRGEAFVRAYRYSISAVSTRTSVMHTNGRPAMVSLYERDMTANGSSENDMTRSPTSYSPESLELQKISV